jgi:hypothetical protein
MKSILTFILISFLGIQILHSQQKDTKITYEGGEAYFIYQDAKTSKIINKVPFAKVRNIYYDTFYKQYIFLLSTLEGATGFTLKYVRENKMFKDEQIMIDSNNNYEWSVNDHLEKLGKLWVMRLKEKDGILQTIYFENVDRKSVV